MRIWKQTVIRHIAARCRGAVEGTKEAKLKKQKKKKARVSKK